MRLHPFLVRWVAISLLSVSVASGQAPETTPPAQAAPANRQTAQTDYKPFLREFIEDGWHIWTSPLKRSNYSSQALKRYAIPFALVSGTLIATDNKTADLLPNTPGQTMWSGRASQLGASYTLAGVSGGTYLLGKVTGNAHARETGRLALHALAQSQIVTFVVKQLTNRERPVDDHATGGFWNGGNSFPSGHTNSSFAVATVFAYEYRQHVAVPVVAYTVATAVAASRMGARRHWLSDIVVGGSTGFLIGRFVYKRHHDPGLPGGRVSSTNRLVPEVYLSTDRVSLAWQL